MLDVGDDDEQFDQRESADGGRRTEDGGRRPEVGGRKSGKIKRWEGAKVGGGFWMLDVGGWIHGGSRSFLSRAAKEAEARRRFKLK